MLIKKELPKPNLDDRNFAQLIDEAIKLIPGFAPEWTDHNLSDPGITLLELFSWITETYLYRINYISERHKLKYLKLLDIYPVPIKPSVVDLTFESEETVLLKKGEKVYTTISGEKISFELKEDIKVTNARLVEIIVDEMTGGIYDRTKMNEQVNQFFAPFGLNIQKNCALYLGFDRPSDTINFTCYLYEKDLMKPGQHGEEPEYDFKNSVLQWEYFTGSGWKSIKPTKDDTKNFKKSGRIDFKDLNDWLPSKIYASEENYYWLRCVVVESLFEYPPRIEKIRLNTCSAIQGETITEKEEWTSNGLPNQKYSLKFKPVLNKSLLVSIDNSYAVERIDFDGSCPQDNHFVLNSKEGEIIFGDGFNGKVPLSGSNIRVERYRICNGKEGNLKEGYSWKLKEEDSKKLKITNFVSATGGADNETIDDANARFIKELRIPFVAVTSSDFEYIAINTPGLRVAKAKALPNYHPEKGRLRGSVTVIVIPFTPLEYFEKPPQPSDGFRDAICRHLNEHRLLGTAIYIIGPEYVKVTVDIEISVSESYQIEDVKNSVIMALNKFLHPVFGGNDHKGWPIGRNVYRSEIYEEIEKINGIRCITKLHIYGDQSNSDNEGNLILPSPLHTIYSGKHSVSIIIEQVLCKKKG